MIKKQANKRAILFIVFQEVSLVRKKEKEKTKHNKSLKLFCTFDIMYHKMFDVSEI